MQNQGARSIDEMGTTCKKWGTVGHHEKALQVNFIHEGKVRAPAAAMALIDKQKS
jgi:hypothetical protein